MKRFYLDCNNGIPPYKVEAIKEKYGSALVGIDPGQDDTPDEESMATIKAVKKHKLALHVYLVGVGMWSWSRDEQRQIIAFAESVGIDTDKSHWHRREWLTWGWKAKTLQQFIYYYRTHGAYSCEIDNLDSAPMKKDPEKTIEYYVSLQNELAKAKCPIKLMIKNLDEDQLEALIDAVQVKKTIKKEFLCEWGMFEEGTGKIKEQIRLCKQLGIYAVTPISGITPTERYGTVKAGVPPL